MAIRSWYVDPNRNADNTSAANMAKWVAWYHTAFPLGLIGGATGAGVWAPYYSCDSVTAGTAGDGVNRWGGGTFDATKIVGNTAGNAHSWFTLFHATLGIYLTVDCNTVANSTIGIAVSKAAPTGGTTTARPTATDEWTYTAQQITEAANNAHKYNGILSTTGDFWIVGTKTTSGLFSYLGGVTLLGNTRSADSCKLVSYFAYNAAGVVTQSSGDLYNNTITTACNMRGRNNINTLVANPMALQMTINAGATNAFSNMITLVNANDGTWDTLPIYVANGTLNASQAAFRGTIVDVNVAPTTLTDGSMSPSSAPFTDVVVGIWTLPWPSSTAALL